MVNYKRVVCVLALVTVAAARTHYDQRQNGTENYRLNIDGVVIAVAPAESLLEAASDIDFNYLFDLDELDLQKPQKPKPPKPEKPLIEPKPETELDVKPQDVKPEKPDPIKPEPAKPELVKPEDLSDVKLNDDLPSQKKEAVTRKQEKANRLKNRLAHILLPLLRRNRHH